MSLADPVPSLRRRRWATPVGAALVVFAVVLIVVAATMSSIPALPSALSMVAGFAIGIGYQFLPFLHGPGSRTPNRRVGVWLVAAAAVVFIAAVAVVALRWVQGPGGFPAVLLAVALAALLVGLTELYPAGENLPGLFLIPVGLDGLMLQSLAPQWSQPAQFAVSLALFVPATGAAVVLTVWAFRVRSAGKVAYTKATETARGVLWAWGLLLGGILWWNAFGVPVTEKGWVNPIDWALPLVTVGSVLAAATTGRSSYVEARAAAAAMGRHRPMGAVLVPERGTGTARANISLRCRGDLLLECERFLD